MSNKIDRATEIHRSMTSHQMALRIVELEDIAEIVGQLASKRANRIAEMLTALKEVTICAYGAMEQANADGAGWDIEFTLREANRLIAMTKGGE